MQGHFSLQAILSKKKPYSFESRFEGTPGASPEELLAVAYAGCFNQALANNLGMIGFEAEHIDTSVTVELGYASGADGHPAIVAVSVTTTAQKLRGFQVSVTTTVQSGHGLNAQSRH